MQVMNKSRGKNTEGQIMRAALLNIPENKFELRDHPLPSPGPREVLVKLRAAAFNHLEIWALRGAFPFLPHCALVGSDGAGQIVEIGEQVAQTWIGSDVVINPSLNWGGGNMPDTLFSILGIGHSGVFADYVCVPVDNVYHKPRHLSVAQAASLPLAGLTAYRALVSRAGLQAGQKVLITGIGGGVALQALQIALALGADVYVTSSSDEKLERARQMGAKGISNYTRPNWTEVLGTEDFDVVLDSSGHDLSLLLALTKCGGMVVNIGMTSGDTAAINLPLLFSRQISLVGSTMGSPGEFEGMLSLVAREKITPIVDNTFPLNDIQNAFESQQEARRFGKTVVMIE